MIEVFVNPRPAENKKLETTNQRNAASEVKTAAAPSIYRIASLVENLPSQEKGIGKRVL